MIWKYNANSSVVLVPKGAIPLSAGMQNGEVCVWMLVKPEAVKVEREFRVVGTGHIFDSNGYSFIGTVQDGSFVWHIFTRERT